MAASGHSDAYRTRRCTCYQEVQGFEIPIIHFPGEYSPSSDARAITAMALAV